MSLPDSLAKIPQQAADARLKRTKDKLGNNNNYSTNYNNYHRGRGHRGGRRGGGRWNGKGR